MDAGRFRDEGVSRMFTTDVQAMEDDLLVTCPGCQQDAYLEEYQKETPVTLVAPMALSAVDGEPYWLDDTETDPDFDAAIVWCCACNCKVPVEKFEAAAKAAVQRYRKENPHE